MDESRDRGEGLEGVVYEQDRDVESDWEGELQIVVIVVDGEEWLVFH